MDTRTKLAPSGDSEPSAPSGEPSARAQAPTDLTDERLETIAKDIETTHTNAVLHIAARLAEARDIFRYRRDEGGFSGWVEARLRYSRSTVYNLLSIHERFGGEKNLSKWLDTFPASILYLLAAPSTPEAAKTEIIARAQAGEPVTAAEVKRVVDSAKGKQPAKKSRRETYPKEQAFEVGAELKVLVATKAQGWTGAIVGTQGEVNTAEARFRDDGAPGHWLIVAPRERVVVDHRVIQWLLLTAPPLPVVVHIDWAFSLCGAANKARCPVWVSERLSGKSHPQRPGIRWPWELPIPQQVPADDIGTNSTAEAARLRVRVEELEADKRRLEIKIRGLESEIEELRGKRAPPADDGLGIPEFLRRAAP